MRLAFSFLLCLFAALTATVHATDRWQSPDRFYSIAPPAGWKQSESKGKEFSSYAFTSPDGKAGIRISATYHLNLPENLPEDVIELAFKNERGVTPIEKIRGDGWDGLRREYANTEGTKNWLAIGARRGSTAILLTMRAPSKDFEHLRPAFESVAQSLRVGQEILSDKDRDDLVRSTLNHFWGNAVDENDKPIQPKDEEDRRTVPIKPADRYRVIDSAIPAGAAMWADLEWESYYKSFMRKERQTRQWSGKQIAFIGVLFGATQSWTKEALSKTPRDGSSRKWAAQLLQQARDDL